MWIKTILLVVLIPLSEESCKKITKTVNRYPSVSIQEYIYLSCTDISPYDDLNSNILANMDPLIEDIVITNSTIPELNQSMFRNVTFKDLTIIANVEIIQSKAFENCNISSILLDCNDIKMIKDLSFNSESIQLLSMENNSLTEIKANNLIGLSGLKKLNLKHNNITKIDEDSFTSLINLKELDLSFNKITDLPFALLRSVTQLQTIFLNNNLLKQVSDHFFTSCKTLKFLNIEHNCLTLIDARYYPTSLNFINASSNKLMSIDFSNLVNADTIDLSFNQVTSIIGWFYNLPSLKYLYVNNNSLGPSVDIKTFRHLRNVNVVDLESNELQNFDFASFNDLPIIRIVSLANNNISYLDFSKSNANIITLNLSKNVLTDIRNLSRIQNLQKLDLSHNNLQEVKYNTFENMVNLGQLLIQQNNIYVLHLGCFRDLRKLKQLDLSHNKIMNIEIGALTGLNQLVILDISYNNLTSLDETTFHSTKHLSYLNIAYNKLSSFEIRNILLYTPWLRDITVIGNIWNCKGLADLYGRSSFLLSRGTSYNVTNVFGIPCINVEDKNLEQTSSANLSAYLNSVEWHTRQISYKMTVYNIGLIALLIILCIKFSSVKCCSCYVAAKQFVYKRYRNEQDMQLI